MTITDHAKKELNKQVGDQKGVLKIRYETKDCGCSGGVPTLWFVPSANENDDLSFETNDRPVLMEKSNLIYFDDELKIDYSSSVNSFQLKSPQQILNGRMALISKIK
nr:iron-sulfur cluster biosynthesis family protein [Bacillus sp. CECT 9360]